MLTTFWPTPTCSNAISERSTSMTTCLLPAVRRRPAPGWRCSTATMPKRNRPGRFARQTFKTSTLVFIFRELVPSDDRAAEGDSARATACISRMSRNLDAEIDRQTGNARRLPSSLKSMRDWREGTSYPKRSTPSILMPISKTLRLARWSWKGCPGTRGAATRSRDCWYRNS